MPEPRQGTPFPFEGPIAPELLIDRDEELMILARRAADRVNVRLAAPRRFGKTSLLLAHAARLRETGWRTAMVDLSLVTDLTDVARRFAVAYAPLDPRTILDRLGPTLGRLGVSVSISGPKIELGPRPAVPDQNAANSVLWSVLDLPKELWERDRVSTLVVFDEFQDLLAGGKHLDGLLRSRIQYHFDAAAYVFTGSEPSLMSALFDRRERPFFGQADPLELGRLPYLETVTDLSARFTSEGMDPGEHLAALVDFAAGHPQRTMLLAYLLADRLALDEISPRLSADVLDDALRRTEPAHRALWQSFDPVERIVAATIADGRTPTSRALAEEHKLGRTTLDSATRRLAEQTHIVRVPRASYLVDPLLAEWLRRR